MLYLCMVGIFQIAGEYLAVVAEYSNAGYNSRVHDFDLVANTLEIDGINESMSISVEQHDESVDSIKQIIL